MNTFNKSTTPQNVGELIEQIGCKPLPSGKHGVRSLSLDDSFANKYAKLQRTAKKKRLPFRISLDQYINHCRKKIGLPPRAMVD